MGLMQRFSRARYVAAWRLRFWWHDTRRGARAQIVTFCLAVLVVVLQLVRMSVAALAPRAADAPAAAVYWWVVQLIIAIVAAVVAYALRPKPQEPQERNLESPTVEDGTAVRDGGGTLWIDYEENFLLAYKVVGQDAIYTKSGKK